MITPGASVLLGSASVAIRAGTPIFNPPQNASRTQAGNERRRGQFRGNRCQGSAVHHAILRCRRIPKVLHQPGQDNPDRPSRLQSP